MGEEDAQGIVPLYDEERHGPLKNRAFAISCGSRWESYTVRGQLVQLPESHLQVQAWLAYGRAQRQLAAGWTQRQLAAGWTPR